MSARRQYALTMPVVPEDELHEATATLLWRVVAPPAEWTCFPAGNVPLPPMYAAKLARFGLQRGWPDFLILHDRLDGIELKRRGAGLSKTRLVRTARGALRELIGQDRMFPRLERAGMRIAVCCSPDDVMAALRELDVPLRGRVAA
ncbi:MAG TPA: hypothetical protein VGI78_10815 [Acetobacteraceae bacterium]|jgi:hypothetical protein